MIITRTLTIVKVEDFWSMYNHILPPSQIPSGTTYYVFKEGIRPEWENPKCIDGGEWIFSFGNKLRNRADEWWLYLVLACIGENFEESDGLCGCAIAVRKAQIRLSVWTSTADKDKVLKIGQDFKNCLELPPTISSQFDFKLFRDQLKGSKNVAHTLK
jgi:translation initiation factor 4E